MFKRKLNEPWLNNMLFIVLDQSKNRPDNLPVSALEVHIMLPFIFNGVEGAGGIRRVAPRSCSIWSPPPHKNFFHFLPPFLPKFLAMPPPPPPPPRKEKRKKNKERGNKQKKMKNQWVCHFLLIPLGESGGMLPWENLKFLNVRNANFWHSGGLFV